MADPAIFRTYMNNTLGIASLPERTAITDSGLDMAQMDTMTPDELGEFLRICRRPGGANGVLIQPATEAKLKKLCMWRRHLLRINRPWVAATATMNNLDIVEAHNKSQKLFDEDEILIPPTPFTKAEHARSLISSLDEYLSLKMGHTGIPLAYITRAHVDMPEDRRPVELDPGLHMPTTPDEMIRRAPHGNGVYHRDNVTVWRILRAITENTPAWVHMKPHVTAKNGRGAYLTFCTNYLSVRAHAVILTQTEDKLSKLRFTGKESHSWTFTRFCDTLVDCFNDMGEAGEAPLETFKVRTLLDKITCPSFAHSKLFVQNSAAMSADFNAAVNQLKVNDMLTKKDNTKGKRNISSTNTGRGGGTGRNNGKKKRKKGNGNGRGDSRKYDSFQATNPGVHYTSAAWSSFTPQQRLAAQTARGSGPGGQRQVAQVETAAAPAAAAAPAPANNDNTGNTGNNMNRRHVS